MYRPTIRYNDVFKDYVDQLFQSTNLDRNQIFRLAMFAAAQSECFTLILDKYKLKDVPLPQPKWGANDNGFWLEVSADKGERKDVSEEIKLHRTTETSNATGPVKHESAGKESHQHRRFEQIEGRSRMFQERKRTSGGGIKIKIG